MPSKFTDKNSIDVICLYCSKQFKKLNSEINRNSAKYCSKSCASKALAKKITCICQTCNKSFFAKSSQFNCGKAKYCSKKCYHFSILEPRISKICIYCNKEFIALPRQVRLNKAKYCSENCYNLYRSKHASTFEEVFLKNTLIPENKNDCWVYKGNKLHGYGRIRAGNKTILAHRFSYEYYKNKIPNEMCVLHKCDRPSCVNPQHLFLGTQADNVYDMVSKNRQNTARGEKHIHARLTVDQVREIKLKLKNGIRASELAREFNICGTAISKIKLGRTWKHV
jgi:HNH endonuclease